MTGASARRAAPATGPGGNGAGPSRPRHSATRAAQGHDGGPLPVRSGLDLHGHFARLAGLHADLADAYRQIADDIQLAARRDRALMDGTMGHDSGNPSSGGLLSADDLASRLAVSPKTVRRWHGDGKLPRAIEIGGVLRWHPGDVDSWIEGQRG